MATRRWAIGTAIFAVLTVLTLVASLVWPSPKKSDASETTTTTTSTTVPVGKNNSDCPNTWAIVQLDNGGHRVVSGGIAEIRDAQTPEQAKQAAVVYLETVKTDPEALAGTAKYFLHRDVDSSTLEKDGCATPAADQLVIEISLTIGESLVTPDEAPADGTNSGIDDGGAMVSAATSGISGDRKAIKVVLKDGSVFWILARCGNPVVKGPGPHPPGPTDNPSPTTPTYSCPQTPKPEYGKHVWNPVTCTWDKVDQTEDEMQNGSRVHQPPQDNRTSGIDTGPTPGAPPQPHVPPAGPTPTPGTPAPNPTPGGYNSGSPSGSGTPGGSTTNPDGSTSGGGPTPAPPGPPVTVDTGTHSGDPGGF